MIASDTTTIAIVVSIAAAVFAGLAWLVATKALQHDRSQTGTSQPVIAKRGMPIIEWDRFMYIYSLDVGPFGTRPIQTG